MRALPTRQADTDQNSFSVNFSHVLPAGTHNVALRCDEAAPGEFEVESAELIVFAIPT
jgi:hypothetical protein